MQVNLLPKKMSKIRMKQCKECCAANIVFPNQAAINSAGESLLKGSVKRTLATRAQSQEEEKTLSIALLRSELKQAQLVPGPDEYDT
mmetsp:Transcript_31625/g.58406  ORF Transcript_31625/g.58406 Transcript_31625/m.58406 type:complete len:87 (-) Transcript_31625:906-1166(-)